MGAAQPERVQRAPTVLTAVSAVLERERKETQTKYLFRCRQLARFYGVRQENAKAHKAKDILHQPFGAVVRKMLRKYGAVPKGWDPALAPSECIVTDSYWARGAEIAALATAEETNAGDTSTSTTDTPARDAAEEDKLSDLDLTPRLLSTLASGFSLALQAACQVQL